MKINDNNDKNVEQNAVVDLKKVLEMAKSYDEIERYTLSNGEDIEFYPHFSRTKIKEIIEEYKGYLISEDKDDMKFMDMVSKDDVSLVLFWYFLAVKKFTHFGESMKRIKKVKSLAPYYNALLETGILEEICNDTFAYEELSKVTEMFAKEAAINVTANEFVNKYEDEIEVAREKFANTYLNKSED